MPDEIDLLRAFRADTPGPDDAAWERARAAVALAEGTATPDPGSHRQRPAGISRLRRPRAARGRVILAAAVVIVVGVAAGVLATVLQPPPSLNAPVTTAWQPARPLPAGSKGVTAPPGTWRLMSYLVPAGWQENTTGPEPGWLTCPTAATCYVEGDNATSASGPADMNSLYVSSDGAQTWSVLPVPSGVTFTSALSCASVTDCAAGGLYYGHQPVYLTTATGGHSWTVRPLPADVGQIMTFSCVTATTCRGLSSLTGAPISQGFATMFAGLRFFATADGGRNVTVTLFPKDAAIQSVACPTASHCVAIGVYSHFNAKDGPDLDHGVLLTSDDGGLTWQRRAWPKGYGPGWQPEVTCTDASHCAMIGFVERNGREGNQVGYTSGKDAVQYTVIGFSADGGKTWTRTSTFPRSMPYPSIDALTCPTTTTCYAAGGDLIAQHIGNTYNAESSVVAVTSNAGRTWQRVTFAVPAQVPGGMQGDSFMDIGQIDCPQVNACVAIGVSDQGSTSTPIYTNHG
jgi:photosystem II stability/assembly factor-like uncharacterized protein